MSRSFIQIKNKDSIYTMKMTIVREQKKRPLRFFAML